MQAGDVPRTWSDVTLIEALTGPLPRTPVAEGVARYVEWFRDYYGA
jgi:UDP-glucuronate 4-epimerase